jgi:hypothetical protein
MAQCSASSAHSPLLQHVTNTAAAGMQESPAIILPGGEITRDAALADCPALHITELRVKKYWSAPFFLQCMNRIFPIKRHAVSQKLYALSAHVAWLHIKVRCNPDNLAIVLHPATGHCHAHAFCSWRGASGHMNISRGMWGELTRRTSRRCQPSSWQTPSTFQSSS